MANKSDKDSAAINFYDDHPYDEFWIGRDYEHQSELIAIRRLLKGRHFKTALDYGGGYGRLAPVLAEFSDEVILTDPSSTLLDLAKKQASVPSLKTVLLKKNAVIPVEDKSIDLLTMIRVSHHLDDPMDNFREIYRVLSSGGMAIIEVANSAHMLNRLKYMSKLKSVPKTPIKIGSASNGVMEDTPFFNHHSKTIEKQLSQVGFKVVSKLSVSNLRSQTLKKRLGMKNLLSIEKHSQKVLVPITFGPSIFILIQKP